MGKKLYGALSLAFLLIFLISIAGLADNLLVPEDYTSIQAAVDAAEKGDSILLSSGSYEGDIVISEVKNLTIRSRDLREFTVVKGEIKIADSTNVALDGFTVTGPGYGVLVRGEVVGLTLNNLAVARNALDGLNFSGGETKYFHVNITNCKIGPNGGDGITLKGTGNDITIRGNEIVANGTYSPPMAGGAAGRKGKKPKGAKAVGVRVGISKKEAAGGAGGGAAAGVLRILIEENIINENAFAAIHSVLERFQ